MAVHPGIDPDGAIPLYQQIFLALRDEIVAGRRPFGAPVPTEFELMAQYGVSRITARRALEDLAAAKLVERRRRVGSRVIFRASPPVDANPDQAIESLIAFGRDTQVRVIEIGEVAADARTAQRLALAEGTALLRALRVRYQGDAPLGAIESFVPAAAGLAITRDLLTRMPLLEIVHGSDHAIAAGSQTISAVAADPDLAARLETEPRAPIIRIERVVRDAAGVPLLLTIAQYRGDRYRLQLDLQGGAHPETL